MTEPGESTPDELSIYLDPEVHVRPDPGITIGDDGRPRLIFEGHAVHGDCWTLYYMENPDDPGTTVEERVIGGRAEDVDWALDQARTWLSSDWLEIRNARRESN